MSVRKGGQVIAGTPNITTGHHVGEIFWTSRLDNKVNGAVDADGAVYSVEAFTGEKSVPELLRKGSLPSVSMAEYESIVSANGSCRAWGWDNGDTFRVPTLKDVYLMAGQAESAGEFISESLPNIKGQHAGVYNSNGQSGALYGLYGAGHPDGATCSSSTMATLYIDASRSSPAYQNGAKVRPDSVRYRAMVQLSTGVQEDATQLKEYKFNNPHFFGESKWTDVDPKNSSWLVSNGAYHSGRTYGDYYKWLLERMNNGVKGVLSSVMYAYSPSGTGIVFTIVSATPKVGMTCYGWSDGSYDNIPISTITSVNQDGTFVASYQGTDYTFERNDAKDQSQCYPTDYDFVINTADETFRLPLLNGEESLPGKKVLEFDLKASGGTYDIPFNGRFTALLNMSGTYSNMGIAVNGKFLNTLYASGSIALGDTFEVKKGDVVTVGYSQASGTPTKNTLQLICATGNGSLYFYVGDTLQDPALINAGEVLDYFSKLNTVHCVVETFKSGSSWYRVYDDGWVEQGGVVSAPATDASNSVVLLKGFTDTSYSLLVTENGTTLNNQASASLTCSKNVSSFNLYNNGYGYSGHTVNWQACGYGA